MTLLENALKVFGLGAVILAIYRLSKGNNKAERDLYIVKMEQDIEKEKHDVRSLNLINLLKYVNERRKRRHPPTKE